MKNQKLIMTVAMVLLAVIGVIERDLLSPAAIFVAYLAMSLGNEIGSKEKPILGVIVIIISFIALCIGCYLAFWAPIEDFACSYTVAISIAMSVIAAASFGIGFGTKILPKTKKHE